MNENSNSSVKDWSQFYECSINQTVEKQWPNEQLVIIFKGNYIPGFNKDFKGKKILEIGCGSGNNFEFYKSMGLNIYGCEVDEKIINLLKNKIVSLNISADLKVGFNINIPYPDNFFDYLVSWNCIHYENNERDIKKAIEEYARVLKPGGRLIVQTSGPKNYIKEGGKYIDHHLFQIGLSTDFRCGKVFFYFYSEEDLNNYFSKAFENIFTGSIEVSFFTRFFHHLMLSAIRKKD